MKKFIYKEMKQARTFMALLTCFLFSASAFGQWTVYDCSVLPLNHTEIDFSLNALVNFTEEEFSATSKILDDPDIPDNSLLEFKIDPDMDTYSDGQRGTYRTDWDISNPSGLTIVTRFKAYDLGYDWIMDLDVHFGGSRAQFWFQNDNTIRFRRGSDSTYTLPEGVDLREWNIFRFVLDSDKDTVSLYINEEEVAYVEEELTTTSGDTYMRFGSSVRNKSVGFIMDWMIWDVTGANSPVEGSPIPDELFVIDDEPTSSFNIRAKRASLEYNVYPNPAAEYINISDAADVSKVSVIDLTGRVVFEQEFNNSSLIKIETTGLRSGVYILHINNNMGATFTDKLTIN
jgi:hypothetical protein